MCKNWSKIIIPENWISSFSNAATVGGIILGFVSLAQAIRDGQSLVWAIFCLAVGWFSGAKLLDDIVVELGPASNARAVAMSIIILIFGILCLLISFFVFRPEP